MSDIMRITVLNQNIVAVQGTQAKQMLVESVLTQQAGALRMFVTLSCDDQPVDFDQVFRSFALTAQHGAGPDDGPYELTGAYPSFPFVPQQEYIQPVGQPAVTEIQAVLAPAAPEGNYTIRIEFQDGESQTAATVDILLKLVSVETALFEYEELLAKLSQAELQESMETYQQLDQLRQLAHSAIISLPAEEQAALLDRYYLAAGSQFSAFKLMLLYRSGGNDLTVAKVKNVGGNAPYSVVFKDAVCIGDAAEAYLFYPEGYRVLQTGIAGYPDDQPDNIRAALTPGQTAYAAANNYVIGGQFLLVIRVEETWYRATYEMAASGDNIVAVNKTPVSIPNAGDEWVSPLEAAMQKAIAGCLLTGCISPSVADVNEQVTAALTADYPVFEAAIDDSILVDVVITANKALPVGASIQLAVNGNPAGSYTVAEAGLTELFVSQIFGLSLTRLHVHNTDSMTFGLSQLAAGAYDLTFQTVAAKSSHFKVPSSRYILASFTEAFRVADRRAALDAAIAGTHTAFTGDVICLVGEAVEIVVTTTYPVFSDDLDPELAVDTLLALNKPMPAGATVQVFADDIPIGAYAELTGDTESVWLNDIINAANLRPNLIDRNNQEVVYKYVFTGLVDSDYILSLKTIAAYQNNFDSIDARYVLAGQDIGMTVTDKSVLMAIIQDAESLLIAHQPGDQPGSVADGPRLALQQAVDVAAVTRDDGDASRNSILDEINVLTDAITEFKTFIVKWRTDKTAIQGALATAEDLLAATTAGENVGQASAEAIDAYQAAYHKAEHVFQTVPDFIDYFDPDDFNAYQAQIEEAKSDLDAATAIFQDARVSDVDYATAKVAEYEAAAQAFYESVRKKIRI